MIEEGDTAPEFTAPMANGDIEDFALSEALADGPVVLAFFPGAFSSVCTEEMCTFRDRLDAFEEVDAEVYGVSTDSPFALNEFRSKHDLNFGLVSDDGKDIVDAYGVTMDIASLGVSDVARRSVFVVDEDREVTYAWVSDNPGRVPDYAEVERAAAEA